jgi:hypothetical protein
MTKPFDPSVLGLDQDDLDIMDDDERNEALVDSLNRAIDLLQATRAAFADDLRVPERREIRKAEKALLKVVRGD